MKIVSLIPARGGSKRLPRKNILNLVGRPLIDYAIKASMDSKIDETWLSTEDKEIKKIALKCGAKILDRPKELAEDNTSTESVMFHFSKEVDCDIIVLIEPTYPMIQKKDIDGALTKFFDFECDSLLTLVNKKFFVWELKNDVEASPRNYSPKKRPRYQNFDGFYVEEGGIYITKKDTFLETECRLNGKIGYYILDHPSIDIDNEIDFKIAETLIKWYT